MQSDLKHPNSREIYRTPFSVDFSDGLRNLDVPLLADFLKDERHGEQRSWLLMIEIVRLRGEKTKVSTLMCRK